METSPVQAVARELRPYLRGYAAVLFCNHELAGLLILAVTFVQPEVGATGLLAAVAGRLTARSLGYPEREQPPEIYNAVLVGLALGATWRFSLPLAGLAIGAGTLTALTTHVLAGWLWRLNRLPVMSLTFVLVTWLLVLASPGLQLARQPAHELYLAIGPQWLNGYFTALGWFLFTPNPLAGMVLLAALLNSSRYLALLSVTGYVAGALLLELLGASVEPSVVGFNFMLAAMAVGGVFAFPDRVSFLWGIFAALTAAVMAVAAAETLRRLGLPPLVTPFLLASYLLLAGLSARHAGGRPYMLLEAPALPEHSLLAARLAKARLGEPGSYPVHPPFYDEWQVSQAIDGPHTHRGLWRHAYDFIVTDERGRSYRGSGQTLEDFLCFGLPLVAPVAGQVWRASDDMVDNLPGEIDARTGRNFGNHLMLRAPDGMFVMLGHIKRGSLKVKQGEWVEAGQVVAACGNSGRLTQPHVHLQVQAFDDIGAATRPLYLRSAIVRDPGAAAGDFRLSARPVEGSAVAVAARDTALAQAVHLAPGRVLAFQSNRGRTHTLQVEVTLLGQLRLVSQRKSSAAIDERIDVLAHYDRRGPRDPCLDAWLLTLGLTPLSAAATRWRDAPPVEIAPLSVWQRLALAVLQPFGANFESRYERTWDEAERGWRQTGQHELRLLAALHLSVTTEALIDPVFGCRQLVLERGRAREIYTLKASGLAGDIGIPATSMPV